MDISATADQGNSMISEMKQHNLGISQHNDDLLLGYNTALSNAKSSFTTGMRSDQEKAIEEGGLNVATKVGLTASTRASVNASGRNYITSDEAWGKLKTAPRAAARRIGQLSENLGGRTIGAVGGGEGSAGVESEGGFGDSRISRPSTTGDDPRYADADPSAGGFYDDQVASTEDPINEAHVAAPTEATPITQVKQSGQPVTDAETGKPANAPSSTDTSSVGGATDTEKGVKSLGELAETGAKAASKVGTGLSLAGGVMDLTADLKAGKIVGDNDWEKASNIAGMAAGGIDALSEAVPIFAPLGALAGLFSAVTEGVGLIEQKDKATGAAEKDIKGDGADPSDKQQGVSTQSLQSVGLVASSGGNPTAHVSGGSAF